jgi:hypothetical protein
MTGVYESELAQFQAAFDAVDVTDGEPTMAEKKPWTPPFTVGEREPGIITDAYLTRPPWEGDDGIYLRLDILHEVKDQSVNLLLPLHGKSEKQTQHVKKTLKTIGYDLDDPANTLAGLEDHTVDFEGKIVEIYTSTYTGANGKTRYNHYINKVLGEAGSQHVKDIADDIPF